MKESLLAPSFPVFCFFVFFALLDSITSHCSSPQHHPHPADWSSHRTDVIAPLNGGLGTGRQTPSPHPRGPRLHVLGFLYL